MASVCRGQGPCWGGGRAPTSLAIYRHIPRALPKPHQGPSLICCVFQGKMEWHLLQGALAEPLSSLVVGMAQVLRDNTYPSGPSEELRLTGHTGGSHPTKPPSPSVLGLCKGARTQHSLRGHGAAVSSDRRLGASALLLPELRSCSRNRASLGFGFLICEMGMIVGPPVRAVRPQQGQTCSAPVWEMLCKQGLSLSSLASVCHQAQTWGLAWGETLALLSQRRTL